MQRKSSLPSPPTTISGGSAAFWMSAAGREQMHPTLRASDYLGIDLNPEYIRDAERRYGCSNGRLRFQAHDAATFVAAPADRFDFVLVNSFLHHVDDTTAKSILANLSRLLTDDGHIHILDLILPQCASIPLFLARADRGDFPRPLEKWRQMFMDLFEPVICEPYDLSRANVCLWKMIYFKGRAIRATTSV